MSESASVSVIIPVYNGERFLAEAIQSVLDQTRPADEIIVVDDGSTDGTAHIVADLAATAAVPIRYGYQANQGPAAARNTALRQAQGALIAFQDADDLWSAEKLAIQVALCRRYPQAHAVIGYSHIHDTAPEGTSSTRVSSRPGPILLLQEGLFRREIFDLVGRLDPRLRTGEDIAWFLHAFELPLEIIVHADVVLTYRRHPDSLTGSPAASQRQLLLALQRSMVRRRQLQHGSSRTATVTFVAGPTSGHAEEADEQT
jgi:glycosyltransferase involved in cell wall biosynthesis